MPKLILIRGVPGSGKTTKAKELVRSMANSMIDVEHFEADQFFEQEDGVYRYDRSKVKLAHIWCLGKTIAALASGKNVIVCNTFVRRWEMNDLMSFAQKISAPVEVIVCRGKYENVHGVPQQIVDEMSRRFEE